MNPPSIILGGGVHGKACWLIAYIIQIYIYIFLRENSRKSMLQTTPSCAIDKKSAWGVCSNTPKYSVHNNTLSIIFLYKNEYFYNFVFTKF